MDKDYMELKKWLDDTKDVPLEAMEGFFDARIDTYEEHMAHWSRHYKWMARLLPENAKALLDLGCGTGLELDCIYSRFPCLKVTGVDLSERMLEKLREKHSDKNICLILQDYFLYEPKEESFDAVVTFQTLHHFTAAKKQQLFEKIRRCLKPSGVYLECDYIAVSQEIEDLNFKECARRRKRDGIPDDAFIHFDTPLTLEHELAAIKAGGFSNVECVGFLSGDNHTAMIRADAGGK